MLTMLLPALAALTIAGQDSLTLNAALERTRTHRPMVRAAAAVTQRAQGASRVARQIPNPSLQYESDNLEPDRKATVVQPLSWIARFPSDLAAGRALVRRAVADSTQMVAEASRETRTAFFAALAAQQQLRLASEQVALADSLNLSAERRLGAGDISGLERDQIAQEAARAKLAAWRAREGAQLARTEFARVVAWTETEPPIASGSLDDGLDEIMAAPLAKASLEQIPALQSALADSAAAAARLRGARWAQLPIPSLYLGREWNRGSGEVANALIGFAVPVPLWNHSGGAAAEARGAAAEAAARAEEARLAVNAALTNAQTKINETAERARFARDSLMPEARRIATGAVRLYEAGRTGILPVFDALRTEREVAASMIRELLGFQEARAELLALLGQ